MRLAPFFAALVFAAPFAFAASEVREAEAPLSRPDGAPLVEAAGACDIREGSDFQRFRLTIRGVGGETPLNVFMGDGHERLVRIGEVPFGAMPRTFLRTTLEHGELPFGVETVRTLVGRRIVIFTGEERVVLQGEVPAFRDEPPPPDDEPDAEPVSERNYMHRTDAAGERESRGVIVAQRRETSSALIIEIGRLAPETGYLVRIGTEGAMTLLDDVRTNREGGAAIVRDTAKGQELPLGADAVSGLAGKRVTVETLDGAVVLYGEVPTFEHMDTPEESVHEEDRFVDEDSGAVVKVEVVVNEETGRERLRVECRDIPRESHEPRGDGPATKAARRGKAEIWLADATDTLRLVDTVRILRGRRAVWSYLAHRGDELPFGATSLRQLAGRAFEIRVGGAVVAAGMLPRF